MAAPQCFKSHSSTFKLETTWKIDHFSTLINDNELLVKNFSDCQRDLCTFYLCVYPNGNDEKSKGHVSLFFLVNFTSNAVNGVFADNQMSIIDKYGSKCIIPSIINEKSTEQFSKSKPGYARFVAHNKLLDANFDWLLNDQLVIHFEGIISIQYTDSNQLGVDLQILLESQARSDVTFLIGADEVKAHKAILSARSPVFAALFEHTNTKEEKVKIEDVHKEAFQEFLKYLYSGQIPEKELVTDDLLVASDKYQVDLLKSVCEELLSTSLTVSNVVTRLNLADMHNAKVLKANCIDFITENAFQVTHTEEWEKLTEAKPKLNLEVVRLITKPKSIFLNQPNVSFNLEPMTFNVEHTWTIADFRYFFVKNDPEKFPIVQSANFSAHCHDQISLQLNLSLNTLTNGQVSLTVELGADIKNTVSINGTFSILDKTYKECESKNYIWNSGEMNQLHFLLGTFLYDRESPFLVNKKLIIQFKGTISYQAINHQKHLDALIEDMGNLLKNGNHSDMSFKERSVNSHKCILLARSKKFKNLLLRPCDFLLQLSIAGNNTEILQTLLKHIYTGFIPEKSALDYDLMIASKKYEMHVLEYACVRQLASSLTIDTVIDFLLKTEKDNAILLKSKCIEFIIANVDQVMDSNSWKKIECNVSHKTLMREITKALATKLQDI